MDLITCDVDLWNKHTDFLLIIWEGRIVACSTGRMIWPTLALQTYRPTSARRKLHVNYSHIKLRSWADFSSLPSCKYLSLFSICWFKLSKRRWRVLYNDYDMFSPTRNWYLIRHIYGKQTKYQNSLHKYLCCQFKKVFRKIRPLN